MNDDRAQRTRERNESLILILGSAVILALITIGISIQLYDHWSQHPPAKGWGAYTLSINEMLLFIVLIGVFPITAVAYRFFHGEKKRQDLTRDFLALGIRDPRAGRIDANAARQMAVESEGRSQSMIHYIVLLVPLMILVFLGLLLVFRPPKPSDLTWVRDQDLIDALRYGFAGSYVYSIYLVYRRVTTEDLLPHVYLCCAKAIILGFAFNLVAFTAVHFMFSPDGANATPPAPGANTDGNGEATEDGEDGEAAEAAKSVTAAGAGIVAIVAFSFGCFPYVAIRWINRVSYRALGERQRRSETRPLNLIDGISQLHETRLRDVGIDNVQNLGAARIDELLVDTPFNAQEVVEWIDQAILYLHVEINEADSFRRAGIRTITGFQRYWKDLHLAPGGPADNDKQQERKERAQLLQTTRERLDSLFETTEFGPNMAYIINYWRYLKEDAEFNRQEAAETRLVSNLARLGQRTGNISERDQVLVQMRESGSSPSENRRLFEEAMEDIGEIPDEELTPDVLVGRAVLAFDVGELKETAESCREAIRRFPNDPRCYNQLAWMYLNRPGYEDKYDEALALANDAVSLSIEQMGMAHPYFLDTQAVALIKTGDPERAVQALGKVIAISDLGDHPRDPYYLETLLSAAPAFLEREAIDRAQDIVTRVREAGYANLETLSKCDQIQQQIDANGGGESGG